MSVVDRTLFVKEAVSKTVGKDILAMAEHVRAGFANDAVAGVIAYGSCLRGVSTKESLVDFYVFTHKPSQVSKNRFASSLCKWLPPNVYYAETSFDGEKVRAKFAVLDIATFAKWVDVKTKNPYFWARFSQPCALIWVCDAPSERKILSCIETAIETMMGHCLAAENRKQMWQQTLVETYQTELRVEGPARASLIVEQNSDYYIQASKNFADAKPIFSNWKRARLQGKMLSVLRLLKASFTFAGGADYLAWKISRHSGQEVVLTPWQRRHPILAAIYLLPGLFKKGAVR